MIRVTVGVSGSQNLTIDVPGGDKFLIEEANPKDILRITDKGGNTLGLFETWVYAVRDNDPEPGYLRRNAAAEAGINYPKGNNA